MRGALLLVLLLAGAAEARAGQERVPAPRTLAAPRPPVAGVVPLQPSVPINPRRSAAFGAVIVAGLLMLQYAHRRKLFILLWASGWLLIAPAMLLIARDYQTSLAADAAIGASQFLGICTATVFFWSGDLFRQTGYVRSSRLRILIPVLAWFTLAPLALDPDRARARLSDLGDPAGRGGASHRGALERRVIAPGWSASCARLGVTNLTTAVGMPRMLATGQFTFEILVVNAVLYTFGALGIHQLVFEDMTYELRMTNRRLEAAREELLQAAITDPLTGCHNRRFLEQVMDRELQRHTRFELPLSLLFIDVNKFKQINDTLGHEQGDRVLQYVARFLKRYIREADYVFRWGGDEFLVLITCGGEEAGRKAGVLRAAFDAAPEAVELPPGIGLSVGWVEVPPGTESLLPLVKEADARMYADKGHAANVRSMERHVTNPRSAMRRRRRDRKDRT